MGGRVRQRKRAQKTVTPVLQDRIAVFDERDPNPWRVVRVRAEKMKAQFAIDRSAAAGSPLAT
jgi:hypothetical protein